MSRETGSSVPQSERHFWTKTLSPDEILVCITANPDPPGPDNVLGSWIGSPAQVEQMKVIAGVVPA